MTHPVDPPRLDVSSDAPELAQRALRVARADIPSAAKLASAEAALFARLGLPPPTGGGGGNPSGGEPSGSPSPNPVPQAAPTGAATGVGVGIVGVVAVSLAVVMTFAVSRPEDPMADKRVPSLASASTTVSAPLPASVALAPSASVPTVSLEDLPKASAQVALPAVPRASAPVAEDESLEVDLVSRAQKSVKSTPAEALRLCDEHARRFPRGSLSQERESLAIEALFLLGRRDEAKARAARFKQAYPASGHLRKLEALGVLP